MLITTRYFWRVSFCGLVQHWRCKDVFLVSYTYTNIHIRKLGYTHTHAHTHTHSLTYTHGAYTHSLSLSFSSEPEQPNFICSLIKIIGVCLIEGKRHNVEMADAHSHFWHAKIRFEGAEEYLASFSCTDGPSPRLLTKGPDTRAEGTPR